MKFYKSPKFLIFLIVIINFLGYGMVFPILPLLTEKYGGDPLISGLLIAVFSLMQVVAMPIMGRLSDRHGRRPLLLFSLWGTVISFGIMGLTHSIFFLMIARIIDGISGGNISIASAYIADITDKKNRAGGMGVLAAGISLGFIFGPLWGGLFSKISLTAPFIAATVLTLISVVLTQFFLPESISKKEINYERKHFDFRCLFTCLDQRPLLILFISSMFLFWAQSGVMTTLSLFGNDVLHISIVKISLILAFGGIISAIIQGFAIGKIVKLIEEEKLFIFSSLIMALGFVFMTFGLHVVFLFIGWTIMSIGNSLLSPVVQSLASEKSSVHEQGGNMGILQSFGSIGRIIGPIGAGYLYQSISPFSPAVMGTIMMILIFLLSLSFLAKNKALSRG